LVTNSSIPSVSRTVAGIVTRALGWLYVASAPARKVMTSAATAGLAARPTAASTVATMDTTDATATLRRTPA
jgi:hypothetical protein